MTIDGWLPQTGLSQKISRDSIDCLNANKPRGWVLGNLTGSDDYGLDYKVQLIDDDQATDVFFLQLKGTTSPKISAGGDFISFDFKASTIRYYARSMALILLVVCDLSVAEDPDACPAYWVWIQEELRRIDAKSLALDAESVTLRVPTVNRLNRGSDFSAHLAVARSLAQVGAELDASVGRFLPGQEPMKKAEIVQNLAHGFKAKSPELIGAVAALDGQIWVNPRRGTLAYWLVEAQRHLDGGADKKAEEALLKADPLLLHGDPVEVAEYWHRTGKLRQMRGEDEGSRSAFLRAAHTTGAQKHWVAWAEMDMRIEHAIDPTCDFASTFEELRGDDDEVVAMRARLTAARGDVETALKLLLTVTGEHALTTKAIILSSADRNHELIELSEAAFEAPDLSERARRLFLILRAEARFRLAAPWALRVPGAYTAAAEIDMQAIARAWEDVREAVDACEESGWANNVAFLAHSWSACASLLGFATQELPRMLSASRARPHEAYLQLTTQALAETVGSFDAALEANSRLPNADEKLLQRIIFLHELGRHRESADLLVCVLPTADRSNAHFAQAVTAAALSANQLARSDFVSECLNVLAADEVLVPARANLEYKLAASGDGPAATAALSRLEVRYRELGWPDLVGQTLFRALNPRDSAQAEKIVEIAQRLGERGVPTPTAADHACVALATLGRWDELLLTSRKYVSLGPKIRFAAFEAIALDKLGQTAQARDLLEVIIAEEGVDTNALNAYINILARCGFTKEAVDVAERVMEAAETRPALIGSVRLAFALAQASDPSSPRLKGLAKRMGSLADPANEEQEGIYLQMMLMSTLDGSSPIDDAAGAEFRTRSEEFFKAHPESRFLRSFNLPTDGTADDLLNALREITGHSEERERVRSEAEEKIKSGATPFPFAWRPGLVLQGVHDVADLWQQAKCAEKGDFRFVLTMSLIPWRPKRASDVAGKMPLIDLLSLLVVSDLGLFDHLFTLFPQIAISKATWAELTRLSLPQSLSSARKMCEALLANLQSRFACIVQPDRAGDGRASNAEYPPDHDLKEIWHRGGYELYSDDVLARLHATDGQTPLPGMSTADLIFILEETCAITPLEAASKFATLISWNVDAPITARTEISALPANLGMAAEVGVAFDELRNSEIFMPLAAARWKGGSVASLTPDMSGCVRHLVERSDFSSSAVTAYIDLWLETLPRSLSDSERASAFHNCVVLSACYKSSISKLHSAKLWAIVEHWEAWRVTRGMPSSGIVAAARKIAAVCGGTDRSGRVLGEPAEQRLSKGLTGNTSLLQVFTDTYSRINPRVQSRLLGEQPIAAIKGATKNRGPRSRKSWWS